MRPSSAAGTAPSLPAGQAHRRFLLLVALRWLPAGLLLPVLTLLPLDRGLSLSDIGLVIAVQGLVCLALELPTGGLADTLGRRPLVAASGVVAAAAMVLLANAGTFTAFAVAFGLQGVFRALDSGPLQAWYVDAVLAEHPDRDLTSGLAAGSVVLNGAVATGALAAGGLIAWDPFGGTAGSPGPDGLVLPVLLAAVVQALGVLAALLLMREPARPGPAAPDRRSGLRGAVGDVPAVVSGGLTLIRSSVVLRLLLGVELAVGVAMVTFEALLPIRLAEVTTGPTTAAAVLGPVTAGAWALAAGGAALAPALARRVGVARAAAALRVLQTLTILGMGLLAGPVGVVVAFLGCYLTHGASNPLHVTLLHRQVSGAHRSTVLSLNSMVAQPAFAVGSIALTALAEGTSVSLAMAVGAAVGLVAAPLYLLAGRGDRAGQQTVRSRPSWRS